MDVDSLAHYVRLYGERLSESEQDRLDQLTWDLGITRFLALFSELGIKATFFTVGQDLRHGSVRQVLTLAVQAGHEPGNHSWSHFYDLTCRDAGTILGEISKAQEEIAAACGVVPTGFRAPGYNTNASLLAALRELGLSYDASPLPSWPYFGLKYTVVAWLRLRGKRSASIVGDPLAGFGPIRPYRSAGLLRIPCTVTRLLRLPVIGTFITMLPPPLVQYMAWDCARQPTLSLEFHAADLLDLADPGLPASLRKQRDLHIPWQEKQKRISAFLQAQLATHNCQTLGAFTKDR